ncbi:MAG: ABC transporter substrate-binding protein [Actinobacteria bacterium]|nr:MAG: ABC transporter substrate-binding protein [Actinomycetota bacterium]
MRVLSTRVRRIAVVLIAGVVATAGFATTGSAGQANDVGITAKAIKVGYIFSGTGIASSTFLNAGKTFKARIDRQNAHGGVNGRKIDATIVDDESAHNGDVEKDLVQNKHVFVLVNNSSFAFTSWRFMIENNVPMVGGGYDGNEYSLPGNEILFNAILGNGSPIYGLPYTTLPKLFKKMGATRIGVFAYGASPSSSAAGQNLQKYAVPDAGLKAVYTNTNVDFGTTDVGPLVLGLKNANADGVYLPMVANTNIAVLSAAAQNGLKFKSAVLATGYGQPLLDQPVAKTLGPEVVLAQGFAPVELKTKATKQFMADRKKYAGLTGVPDFGEYMGYITGELLVLGLEHAGNPPTRKGFVDGLHQLGSFDWAGMACQPIDISLTNYGKSPQTQCSWYMQIKNGKFVAFPKNGKPWRGKLIPIPGQ